MLNKFSDWVMKAVRIGAATQLAPVPVPKVKKGQLAFPSYLKSTRPSDSPLPLTDRRLATTNPETYRGGLSTRQVIRDFVAASPDLSAAVFAYIRTAITGGHTAVAKNLDGTFNREATDILQQLLVRFNVLQNYDDGFSGMWSLRSTSEALAKELVLYGACSMELALDKARLPSRLVPLSVTNIEFKPDDRWLKPVQKVGGDEIDLDIPTFFYVALDQNLLEPYSESPLESAIHPVMFSTEFTNDLRRIVKKAIHPRLSVIIDEDKFNKNIPAEYSHDPKKLQEYKDAVLVEIEAKVNDLKPEDALVLFDTLGISYLNNGNISLDAEYETLNNIVNSKLATGAKTLPAILGHGAGSQNIASAEVMLFMKNAEGAVQGKLNEIYSRAFTLALRLFGFDVYAEFKYDEIDLRPSNELESFRALKQSRVLEQLSLGLVTDEEASLALNGRLPPAGMKPLSGTLFQSKKADPTANPNNGTSNDGSALNQNLKSDAPKSGRGQNKKAEGEGVDPQLVAPNLSLTVNTGASGQQSRVIHLRRDPETNTLIMEEKRPEIVPVAREGVA